MKRCPKCGQLFTNELLKFCRQDGQQLVDSATTVEEATTLLLSPKNVPIGSTSFRIRHPPVLPFVDEPPESSSDRS